MLPKMSGYIKTFKKKNNELISLRIDDEEPLERYKTIWIKIEDLKNIELNYLPVYDNVYICMYVYIYIYIYTYNRYR